MQEQFNEHETNVPMPDPSEKSMQPSKDLLADIEPGQQPERGGRQRSGKNDGGQRSAQVSQEKGKAYYPISDLQFDVITVIHEKSKALQAYDRYLRDCLANEELRKVFEGIKQDDYRHVEQLKRFLKGN